jgi:threonine dehydrogenase-like Zn-dependent dehydrogenase
MNQVLWRSRCFAGAWIRQDRLPQGRMATCSCQNGAAVINFEQDNAVDMIVELTGRIGTDRTIDATHPHGPSPRPSASVRRRRLRIFAPRDACGRLAGVV